MKNIQKHFNGRKLIVIMCIFTVLTFLPIVIYLYLSKTIQSVAYTTLDNFNNTVYLDIANSTNYSISNGSVKVEQIAYGYGTGADGACTVSANKEINTGSCVGRANGDAVNFRVTANVAAGSNSVTLSSAPTGLAIGDEILIINLQGTAADYGNVGKYDTAYITGINGNTLALDSNLVNGYDGTTQKIMVQRIPQYTDVTINAGVNWYPSAWDGTKGGVMMFKANGTVTVNGTITVAGRGYRGGAADIAGGAGETFGGYNSGTGGDYNLYGGVSDRGEAGNMGGGGGGGGNYQHASGGNSVGGAGSATGGAGGGGGGGSGLDFRRSRGGGGGGGGYGTAATAGGGYQAGTSGGTNVSGNGGSGRGSSNTGTGGGGGGGGTYGVADLSKVYFGSGGGGAGTGGPRRGGAGGIGGGIVIISANSLTVEPTAGVITAGGYAGSNAAYYGQWACAAEGSGGGGGGAAGGSIKLITNSTTAGTNRINSDGGNGGLGICHNGGNGGSGRVRIQYVSSLSGTTRPAASTLQAPLYKDSMILQSLDLVHIDSNAAVLSFAYSLSSSPAGTSSSVQFSTDALTWYNSSGNLGGSDSLSVGVDNIIDLTALEWLTPTFFYKITTNTNGASTPVLDSVSLNYDITPSVPTIGEPEALSTDTIRWNFTDNATNEEGFILVDEEGTLIKYCLGENLTYCDETGLQENTQYTRGVKAYNALGESVSSETATVYTLVSVPSIFPGGSKTASSLTLSALGQVNNSEIYFDCENTGCDTGINEWISTSTDEVTNLDFNTPYTFKVKGRNGDSIETPYSESITVYTLAEVPSISLTPLSSTSVTLTAEGINNVNEGNSGVFFECEEEDCSEGITEWVQSESTTVTNLDPNRLYFFRVKARNFDGVESTFSEYMGTYTKSSIPNIPTVVSQTTNSITIALSSDNNPEGTQYAIMEEKSGKYVDISTGSLVDDLVWGTYTQFGSANGKEVVGLEVGTEYIFKAKSRNEDDIESDFSQSVTTATKLNTPTLLSALTTTTNSFTWRVTDENASKVGYRIYDSNNNLLLTCSVNTMNQCIEGGLSSNTEYSRKVKVYSNISESDYSNTFLFSTYSEPSNISSLTAVGPTSLRLTISGSSRDNLQIMENKSNRYYSNDLKVLTSTSSMIPFASTIDIDGLLPNTQYEFKIRSLNRRNIATAWSSNQSTYTLAQRPAMVRVNAVSSNSARVYINSLDNPADTELLIRENNTGNYIDFNTGRISTQEVWGTFANFGSTNGILLSGLEVGTQYGFSVKARNKLLAQTDWSDPIFIGTGAILQNVDANLRATLTNQEVDLTSRSNAQFGEKIVRVKKGDILVADVPVLFNQDRDWANAVILSSSTERKSVVKLGQSHGVSKPYTMYVNRDDTNGFLICPAVSKLEDVKENCLGGVRFTGNFPQTRSVEGVNVTVSQTVIGGINYWIADGLTGTGGLGFYFEEPVKETPVKEEVKEEGKNETSAEGKKETTLQKIVTVLSEGYTVLQNAKNSALGILDNTVVKDLKENELQTVSTTANVVTVTVGTTALLGGLTQLGYVIVQFFAVVLSSFGFRKKRVNYGFVYDSNTKEPVHMALVRIYNTRKRLMDTAVTDVNGRFSASLNKGKYTIEVSKSGYEFPSVYVKGSQDYPLQNVYTGALEILSEDAEVQVAVPIDPKEILGAMMFFYRTKNVLLKILSVANIFIFLIGVVISFYTYFTHENVTNLMLLLLYIIPFVILVRSFVNKKGQYGKVVDENGKSLSGISVIIREKEFDKVIAKRVTNSKGKYRFILDKGKYELDIDEKGYELIDIKRGSLIDVRRDNYVLTKRIKVKKS